MRRLLIVPIIAIIAATAAHADAPPQPNIGRTVAYCQALFAAAGVQRNALADDGAQKAAQLDVANKDVAALQTEVQQLQAEIAQLKKVPPKK